ncbi:MAG: YcxB family protein [Erysipelotrichaceae bacterium]|nr:YcxB family protein [Erysipelotrichaceae bacterium]
MFTFVSKNFKEDAQNFSKYNYEKNYKNSMITLFIGGLITFLLSLLLIVLKQSLWISITLLVLSICIIGLGYISYRSLTKGASNVEIDKIEEVITTFNKDNFEVVTKYIENGQATATQEYRQIQKIEENDKYYFLFLTKISAYVVRKDSLQNGSISDFRKFLRKEKNFDIVSKQEKENSKNRQRRRMENKK